MRKLGLLLHDTTIINFEKFFSLMKRYRALVFIFPIVAALAYFYLGRMNNKIYFQSSLLTIKSKAPKLPGLDASLFEEQSNSPLMEFKSDISTWNFKSLLSEKMLAYDDFDQLNFSDSSAQHKLTGLELREMCEDERNCLIEKLNFYLAFLYKIKESALNGKGNLEVYTLDEMTTYHLRQAVESAIIDYRLQSLKSASQKERETLEEIVESKKQSLFKNGQEEAWKLKEMELKLQDITAKIAKSEGEIGRLKNDLTRLDYDTTATVTESVELSESQVREFNLLKDELEGISRNIAQLNLSGALSELDLAILGKLKAQYSQKKRELGRFGINSSGGKIIESNDRTQYNRKKTLILSNIEAKTAEVAELRLERQAMVQDLSRLSDKARIDSVSYEYVQSLEKRLIELKLAEATVEADVVIDSTDPSIQVLYRMRRSLIVGFSLALGLSFWMIAVVIRFFIDSRIYSDDEIYIGDGAELEVIGEAPILG